MVNFVRIPKNLIEELKDNACSGERSNLVGGKILLLSWTNDNDTQKIKDFPLQKDNAYYYFYHENHIGFIIRIHLQVFSCGSMIEFQHPIMKEWWNESFCIPITSPSSDDEEESNIFSYPLFFNNNEVNAIQEKIRASSFLDKNKKIMEHLITRFILYSQEDNYADPIHPLPPESEITTELQ